MVAALVDGGATCVGKTVVDDMALGFVYYTCYIQIYDYLSPFLLIYHFFFCSNSVSGENRHYESPTNTASPARVPGGASSGAAVAVAAKLADFSLGEMIVHSIKSY